MHLRARFFGLLLIGAGVAAMFLLYAFWRSGFETPIKPPVPPPMSPSMGFAFNPLVCAMPFVAIGAVALMVEGFRRLVNPADN